jgi:biotin synthase
MDDLPYRPREADLASQGALLSAFHERAAAARRCAFGRQVFVRGVVEVSNYCRQNCAYCGMRRDNAALTRYRAHCDQLSKLLIDDCPPSLTDVNLQAGEDVLAVREIVLPLIRALRRETSLGVSVSLGTLTDALYRELQGAGASIYIMKFECGDPAQYARFQAPGTLAQRLEHIRSLAAGGWNVSSGFIVGLPGQTTRDYTESLLLAAQLPLRGCSVSPFIPGEDTPLASAPPSQATVTLNCMAALRLMRPDWVIPAVSALNLAAADGYRRGLRAGANLVTMNLTPPDLRGDYIIYKRERFIMTEERVLAALDAEALTPSTQSLAQWYRNRAADAKTEPLLGIPD